AADRAPDRRPRRHGRGRRSVADRHRLRLRPRVGGRAARGRAPRDPRGPRRAALRGDPGARHVARRFVGPSRARVRGALRVDRLRPPGGGVMTLEIPKEGDAVLDVEGRAVKVTNLGKVFFPEIGLTKADLIRYYVAVAPALLPHVRDRAM